MFIEMEGIRRTYGEGDGLIRALDGVDLTVEKGEFVAIVGSSGCGKSTLLQILGCLDRAESGSYHLDGQDVHSLTAAEMARVRNETIGFVFQSFHLLGDRDALENVTLPLQYRRSKLPETTPRQVLDRPVGAPNQAHRLVSPREEKSPPPALSPRTRTRGFLDHAIELRWPLQQKMVTIDTDPLAPVEQPSRVR